MRIKKKSNWKKNERSKRNVTLQQWLSEVSLSSGMKTIDRDYSLRGLKAREREAKKKRERERDETREK